MDAINDKSLRAGPGFVAPVLPEGKHLIDVVRVTLNGSAVPHTGKVAKLLGLTRNLYDLAKKLTIIKDRQVATLQEEIFIDKALQILEESGNVALATLAVQEILTKYWQRKTRTGIARDSKTYSNQLKRFENTLFAIRETCSNNDEMEIPQFLTRQERDDHAKMLVEAIEDLWDIHDDILQQPRRRRT